MHKLPDVTSLCCNKYRVGNPVSPRGIQQYLTYKIHASQNEWHKMLFFILEKKKIPGLACAALTEGLAFTRDSSSFFVSGTAPVLIKVKASTNISSASVCLLADDNCLCSAVPSLSVSL